MIKTSILNVFKISFLILVFSGCDHTKELKCIQVSDLIQKDGTLSDKIVSLAHQMNISFKDDSKFENSNPTGIVLQSKKAEEFTDLVQGRHPLYKNFSLRQTGKERWEMSTSKTTSSPSDQERFAPTTEQVSYILRTLLDPAQKNAKDLHNLGMGGEQLPTNHNYEHILLLGSTYQNFEQRLIQLKRTLQIAEASPGFNPKKITIFLISGIRSLNPDEIESLNALQKKYQSTTQGSKQHKVLQKIIKAKETKNEFEMHNAQLAAFALQISPEYSFAFTNEKTLEKGQKRSSTESTLAKYIKDQIAIDPECWNKKNILLVSTHIFGLYQKLIAKRVLRLGSAMHKNSPYLGSIDITSSALKNTEGNHFNSTQKLAIAADNLSRIFYEITSYKKTFNEYPSD